MLESRDVSEEDNENEESLDVDDEGLEGDEETEERNLTVRLRRQELQCEEILRNNANLVEESKASARTAAKRKLLVLGEAEFAIEEAKLERKRQALQAKRRRAEETPVQCNCVHTSGCLNYSLDPLMNFVPNIEDEEIEPEIFLPQTDHSDHESEPDGYLSGQSESDSGNESQQESDTEETDEETDEETQEMTKKQEKARARKKRYLNNKKSKKQKLDVDNLSKKFKEECSTDSETSDSE
ncbi:X-linked retinitis pigmentosa GTPase regulator-like [Daphnia pulicaria]|uniref:X-linked retinitis pigmentosa GTPase regulator-like n=1 Tax=Daphnia pulicaria TaxID=35523 RepID=UPI001EEB6637|nr:X-linked retinitis pigmentosa GTPase regulator-like [Daphnia pulicaria]